MITRADLQRLDDSFRLLPFVAAEALIGALFEPRAADSEQENQQRKSKPIAAEIGSV
jgi:hypothetical protein